MGLKSKLVKIATAITNFCTQYRPISSVISSTLDCNRCKTSNLTENVTIFFDLPPRKANLNTKCVFANLQ